MSRNNQTRIFWEKIGIGITAVSIFSGLALLASIVLNNSGNTALFLWWLSLVLLVLAIASVVFSRKGHRRSAIIGLILCMLLSVGAIFVRIDYWLSGITW